MPAVSRTGETLDAPVAETGGGDGKYTLVCFGERAPRWKMGLFSFLMRHYQRPVPYDRIRTVALLSGVQQAISGPATLEDHVLTDATLPSSLAFFITRLQGHRTKQGIELPYLAVHNEAGRQYLVNTRNRRVLPCYAEGGFPVAHVPADACQRLFNDFAAFIQHARKPHVDRLLETLAARLDDPLFVSLARNYFWYGRQDMARPGDVILDTPEYCRAFGLDPAVYAAAQPLRDAVRTAIAEPAFSIDISNLHPIEKRKHLPEPYREYSLDWTLGDKSNWVVS